VASTANERCPELFQLLGGWLHQDFDLEYQSAEEALAAAIADASLDRLRGALDELRRSRPSDRDEEATREFANELCWYHPPGDGLTYVEWLDHVEVALGNALQSR
jgi:hypothetical protein